MAAVTTLAAPHAAESMGAVDQWSAERLPATAKPHRNLLRYYLLTALLTGPGFLFAALPLYLRFRTLRYDLDAEGITMRWGILFRREVSLTYARIQDIQLTSNVVERWLGLARIQLQTASGSASAEMTIEGMQDVDGLRDFLYSRMRGAADVAQGRRSVAAVASDAAAGRAGAGAAGAATAGSAADVAALTAALEAAAAEMRALRLQLTGGRSRGGSDA